MPDPYSEPEDLPPAQRFEGYNPLRHSLTDEESPAPIKTGIEDMLKWQEAIRLQAEDFAMDVPDTAPPSEPAEDYAAPATWDEAEGAVNAAEQQVAQQKALLDKFTEDTRSIVPMGKESTNEVLRRAELIAKARKDLAKVTEGIASSRAQIAQGKLAQNEDPEWWQETLGVVGDTLGALSPVLNLLSSPQEIVSGLASFGVQGLSAALGDDTQFTEMGMKDWATLPIAWTDKDHVIRQRGQQMNRLVGEYTAVTGLGPLFAMELAAKGVDLIGWSAPKDFLSEQRPLANEISFSLITDPLNVLEAAGPLTKLGRLRELARVNSGALETAAVLKSLDEMPDLLAKFASKSDAIAAAQTKGLVVELRKLGVSGDEATALARAYDAAWVANAADLRNLASTDSAKWAETVRGYLASAPKEYRTANQLAALDRVGEFGDKVDPILGRTMREQAILGQRGAAWKPMFERFGDSKWFKIPAGMYARLAGTSLKNDIADNPLLIELYYAQRAFKGDAGAEFMRFQQDTTARAAALLRQLEPAQVDEAMEALPGLVENPVYRNMLKSGVIPADKPLHAAVYSLAELYDESAETLRAIQNRFNLDVADLTGEFGFLARGFGDEMKSWLLTKPKAREFLYADSTLRSREHMSAALMNEERARKLGEFDFYESEEVLRKKFRAFGLPDNVPIWSRDAFGTLAKRAEKSMRQAEIRNLYGAFVEVFGTVDDSAVAATRGAIRTLVDERNVNNMAKAADAADGARAAAEAQAGFREGRKHVRDGYAELAGPAVERPVAGLVNKNANDAAKAAEDAVAKISTDNPNNWGPNKKAKWLLGRPEIVSKGVDENALAVLLKARVKLPDSWDELARLAATNFTPKQAEEFARLAKGMYWDHLATPSKFWQVYDSIKAIYQRTTLARVASLTKDLIGTATNMLMEGDSIHYLPEALKELGDFVKWQKGGGSDLVNRLRAQGVLRTTKGEALDQAGTFEKLMPGALGKPLANVEKLGMVGGGLRTIEDAVRGGAAKLGLNLKQGKGAEKVAKTFGALNDARVYWEEAGRIATYLRAQRKGYSHQETVEEVFKWWGKFDELSVMERQGLNRIMFFWSWMARSIPITMRHLLTHPVRSKWLLTVMAGDVTDNENMPPWLRRMGGWALGRNAKGNVDVINIGGSTYFSPMFAALQGDFANSVMQGKPLDALAGAGKDVLRSSPPMVQGAVERVLEYDLFTDKPWWQDRNAKADSNIKAPNALGWFEGTPIGDVLRLEPVTDKGDPGVKYYKISPEWAWFFSMVPGLEPALGDVSAFFRNPEDGSRAPRLSLDRGFARTAGFPMYDVAEETGKRQIYDFRNALIKQADQTGTLRTIGGRVVPTDTTLAGQQLRQWRDGRIAHHRRQGMKAVDAERQMLNEMVSRYPDEGRIMLLQDRLERWEKYILAITEGKDELTKAEGERIGLIARQADASRIERDQRAQERKRMAKLGLR